MGDLLSESRSCKSLHLQTQLRNLRMFLKNATLIKPSKFDIAAMTVAGIASHLHFLNSY